jgi:hypothetical protein
MTDTLIERAQRTTLALTVTSGRSGTKLLTVLLRDALGLAAEHEPAPRANFVMRSFVEAPSAAAHWLQTEKLPAMLRSSRGGFYAETSHLFCKCLIEPLVSLGIRPKLIILTRPAREVGSSLYQLDVIPERTENGRLVLLGPSDPGVLKFPNWQQYSDYQLCYWYAREIERRQAYYMHAAPKWSLSYLYVSMYDLRTPDTLLALGTFLGADTNSEIFAKQCAIIGQNHNTKDAVLNSSVFRPLPDDIEGQEMAVDAVVQINS